MKIGVAIPCYKYHIPKLIRCLESIEAQTLKADQVVVSCSSSDKSDFPSDIEKRFSFPLVILTTPDRKNAAENRNIAISHLTTDLVSFFDADDIMHPQRLEFIKHAFYLKRDCKIVI
jgi:glycosyltransferase involved in cell wall biosynthesis